MWFFKSLPHPTWLWILPGRGNDEFFSAQSPVSFPSVLLIENDNISTFKISWIRLKHWSECQGAIIFDPDSEPWKVSSLIMGVTFTKSLLLPFHFWCKPSIEKQVSVWFCVTTMRVLCSSWTVYFHEGYRSFTSHGSLDWALLSQRHSLSPCTETNCRSCAQLCCTLGISETSSGLWHLCSCQSVPSIHILHMHVAVTKSQVCLSQTRNRECTWANTVGGAQWDRIRELSPARGALVGTGPVRTLPAAGPLWLRFIVFFFFLLLFYCTWLVLSLGKCQILGKGAI